MELPETLQPLLRCPICKADFAFFGDHLLCSGCHTQFPIINGVPILINEHASVFSIGDFVTQQATFFNLSRRQSIVGRVENLLPSLHRSDRSQKNYQQLAQLLLQQTATPVVLVIGGSILGRGLGALLSHCPALQLIESDVSFGPRTIVICDAHDIPFADLSFDAVIAQAVLEHVVDPERCVSEIYRVLKHNGILYAETPFMQQVHGGRYDFTRFTHLGHRRLFRRFSEIDSGIVDGPGTALAWAYQYFLLSFVQSVPARAVVRAFAQLTSFYLKYIDRYLERKPGSLDAASGYFFLGRRSEQILSDKELLTLYRGSLV